MSGALITASQDAKYTKKEFARHTPTATSAEAKISSCLRQVLPPCQPSTLGGDCSNDDGKDDGGGDDDDDDD